MRDAVLSGENAVADEDIVRCANAAMRAMTLLRNRKDRDKPEHVPFWKQAPSRMTNETQATDRRGAADVVGVLLPPSLA
jgi:hypothetical protein